MLDGANDAISLFSLSAMPGYIVDPPLITMLVEFFSNVDITFHDGVVTKFVETGKFLSNEWWLEQGLGASEPLVGDGDGLSIWQFTDSFILVTFFICYILNILYLPFILQS